MIIFNRKRFSKPQKNLETKRMSTFLSMVSQMKQQMEHVIYNIHLATRVIKGVQSVLSP